MPTPRHHTLFLVLVALPLLLATAQPDESRGKSDDRGGGGGGFAPGMAQPSSFSAPLVVLLVALIAAFFFIGFFSIYIRQCGRGSSTGPAIPAAALLVLSRQQQQQNQQRGLDPAVVASFPTMRYAEARELRDGGKDTVLECAVCLSEFDDEEELRLLPKCSHAFHPDCIGEWLACHVTCPVCRCSLDPEEPAAADVANSSEEASGEQQEVAIDVNREDGEEEERRREAMELERIGSQRRAVRSQSGRPLPRSHSTGHSLTTRLDGDHERFTLRLPEHVRREMVAAGEESLRRTGVREGRVGGGARSARIGRSDRWPSFIARTISSRVPFWAASRRAPDAEVGVEGSTTPAATARAKREKTAAAADGAVSPAKGSVRFDCLGGGGVVSGARVGAVAGDSDEEEEEKPIARQV